MDVIIDNADMPRPFDRMPQMPHETDLGGLRLLLLPPGKVNLRHRLAVNAFDVNLSAAEPEFGMNTDKTKVMRVRPETLAFLPNGTDCYLRVENKLPGCVLEVEDETLAGWMAEGEIDRSTSNRWLGYRADGVVAEMGRSAIRHLMRAARSNVPTDRLTIEALALGIAARGMAQLGARDGDVEAEISRWARHAHGPTIDRAIDLIEAQLTSSELSIQELASSASLSSSHFSSVFKSAVGEPPYSFILRRRAEYARDLIIGTREPLSQIAYDAGFSSQAHMTVVIRRIFGVTPAAMRN